jgi:hypothetical protein
MRTSPAISVWLLERLGLDPALTGDLLEECARGRSVVWYWRQVWIAVWVGIWNCVLDNKLLAVRAIAIGWATNLAFWFLYLRFLQPLAPVGPYNSMRAWLTNLSIILITQPATGWILARTHRAHPIPMVSAFAGLLVVLTTLNLCRDFSYVGMLVVDSLDQPRFRPYLARYLATLFVPLIVQVIGLYLGAMLAPAPSRKRAEL